MYITEHVDTNLNAQQNNMSSYVNILPGRFLQFPINSQEEKEQNKVHNSTQKALHFGPLIVTHENFNEGCACKSKTEYLVPKSLLFPHNENEKLELEMNTPYNCRSTRVCGRARCSKYNNNKNGETYFFSLSIYLFSTSYSTLFFYFRRKGHIW